jgi:hypothetical protein
LGLDRGSLLENTSHCLGRQVPLAAFPSVIGGPGSDLTRHSRRFRARQRRAADQCGLVREGGARPGSRRANAVGFISWSQPSRSGGCAVRSTAGWCNTQHNYGVTAITKLALPLNLLFVATACIRTE